MKVWIHFFSATGNTARAVRLVGEQLEKAGHGVAYFPVKGDSVPPSDIPDLTVVAFPIWSWAAPHFLLNHVKRLPRARGARASVLSTCGGFGAQGVEEVARLLAIPADRRTMTDGVLPRLFGKRPSDEGRGQTLYDNKWDEVLAEWTEATRQESAWDCVMAVQGYEQHRSHIRNTTRDMASVNRLLRDDFPMTRKAHALFV